jgi:hypothetical protein
VSNDFVLDKTGFPMIWVHELNAYIHFLPVTKVQFEYFICDQPRRRFDEDWYNMVIDHNPRVAPQSIDRDNYAQAFMTAIIPDEVRLFTDWCGSNYSIPTREQWFTAYTVLEGKSAIAIDDNWISTLELRERAVTVVQRLEREMTMLLPQSTDRKLADQMMMRGGIFEWVLDERERPPWVGMGKPHSSFVPGFFSLERGNPTFRPRNPETDRLFQIGFRLLKKV